MVSHQLLCLQGVDGLVEVRDTVALRCRDRRIGEKEGRLIRNRRQAH